jgi:asparagine synthetase B (glutamine-hydrolysing)
MKLLRAGQTEDFSSRLRHHVKGEYAFVLLEFDRLKNLRRVVAGRDEIGVRPLYVSAVPDVLLFTSELKGAVGYEGEMIDLWGDKFRSVRQAKQFIDNEGESNETI